MDLGTLERILREGPPDEPIYVPGAMRLGRTRPAWLLFAAAIGLALVIGVAAGLGLDALRKPTGDPPSPIPLTPGAVQGSWLSEPITREEWFARLMAQGFDREELTPVFDMGQFERVQYGITLSGSNLTIMTSVDGGPLVVNSRGTFDVDGDTFVYVEDQVMDPGLGDICHDLTARIELRDGQLVLSDVQLPEAVCGRHPLIIHAAFFTLAPFDRTSD